MRLAVVTVVHPVAGRWLPEMAASLRRQTDRSFVLVAVDDGVNEFERVFAELDVRIIPAGASPAENRRVAIEAAVKGGFDLLVFADADDTFPANRVARCRAGLAEHPLVFHDLHVNGEPILRPRFEPGARVGLDALLDHNCLGLSNTAARADVLAGPARTIRSHQVAVDWALFTRAALAGHEAVFLDGTFTAYRRHEGSFAMLGQDDATILRAVEVKAAHYRAVGPEHPKLDVRRREFEALLVQLREDTHRAADYFRYCRAHAPADPLWWEIARRPA